PDLGAVAVAQGELPPNLVHLVEVTVDLGLSLDLHTAQLGVSVPRLQQERGAGVALKVASLLRLGVRVDPDLAITNHVPEGHRVRPSAGTERGDDDDPLLL